MIPDKIYLQIKDENGEAAGEITWCEDKIHDTDIEYVRVVSRNLMPTGCTGIEFCIEYDRKGPDACDECLIGPPLEE